MLGTVAALYRYPVKALRAERLARAEVLPGGIAGDRACALLVTSPDHARTGKTYRGKENRLLHTVGTLEAARELGERAGLTLEAADEADHYVDAEPVSIVFDAWIRELEALAGRTLDPLRFRPNVVATAAPSFARSEHELTGTHVRVGAVRFAVVAPIVRCVTPSYDVATGEPDPALARRIVADRGNIMGVYCRVIEPGTIEPGDVIAEP